jgi:DNA-directed RNA polymerase
MQERLCRESDLSRVYEALDVLSATPWTINTKILDIMQLAWTQDLVRCVCVCGVCVWVCGWG